MDGRTTLGPTLVSLRTEFMADVIQVWQHLLLNPLFSRKMGLSPQQPGRLYPQSLATTLVSNSQTPLSLPPRSATLLRLLALPCLRVGLYCLDSEWSP